MITDNNTTAHYLDDLTRLTPELIEKWHTVSLFALNAIFRESPSGKTLIHSLSGLSQQIGKYARDLLEAYETDDEHAHLLRVIHNTERSESIRKTVDNTILPPSRARETIFFFAAIAIEHRKKHCEETPPRIVAGYQQDFKSRCDV